MSSAEIRVCRMCGREMTETGRRGVYTCTHAHRDEPGVVSITNQEYLKFIAGLEGKPDPCVTKR